MYTLATVATLLAAAAQGAMAYDFSHSSAPQVHVNSRSPFSRRALQDMADGGGDDDNEMAAGEDDDVRPAPASIGTDVPLSYFGPAPSDVQRELIGPFQLLNSGVVDEDAGTITMPIYTGIIDEGEKTVFYIVTDTSDKFNAQALGLNHSPKLQYANVGKGARKAYLAADQIVHFANGDVDFGPELVIKPGEDSPFPPAQGEPGAIGDEYYSPLFVLENAGGHVYNGPIVSSGLAAEKLRSYCDGIPEEDLEEARKYVHDKVLAICPNENGLGGTVTIELIPGFSFARPVLYLSMDASMPVPAAIEGITLAPALADIMVGTDDVIFSAVERIFITINGPTNEDINSAGLDDGPGETVHPARQGLNSALLEQGAPLNVLGGIPTIATDYSPLWDANLGMWTEYAIANGYRVRLLEEFQILAQADRGFLTGPDGAPYGSSGFIVNCPIVFRFL